MAPSDSVPPPVPEQDYEYRQAIRLLSANPLDRQIILELAGHPHRYGELRPLLEGRNDNALNRALKRLTESGLVDRRTDAAHDPPLHTYELNNLGIAVLLAMAEIRAVPQIARLARAALADPATAEDTAA